MLATLLGGAISISAAAFLSYGFLSRIVERMVSLSVGILLSTSLLHALPEAFESDASIHALFATLLAGLLGFFLLARLIPAFKIRSQQTDMAARIAEAIKADAACLVEAGTGTGSTISGQHARSLVLSY